VHALSDAFREIRCSALTFRTAFESLEVVASPWCAGNNHFIEVRSAPTTLAALPTSAVTTGGSLHLVMGKDFLSDTMCVQGFVKKRNEIPPQPKKIC
jgi:hypothetical protein